MRTMQMVETTQERYEAHRMKVKVRTGTVERDRRRGERGQQCLLYLDGMLVAMGVYNYDKPAHSQFFIYEEVEMGVTTKEVGFNG